MSQVYSKGMFLHIAQYPVRCTTLYTSPPGSFRHLLNFSGKYSAWCCNTARWLFTLVSTAVYSQVLIYTDAWTRASWKEPGPSLLRVRDSTAELPRSTGLYLLYSRTFMVLGCGGPRHIDENLVHLSSALQFRLTSCIYEAVCFGLYMSDAHTVCSPDNPGSMEWLSTDWVRVICTSYQNMSAIFNGLCWGRY